MFVRVLFVSFLLFSLTLASQAAKAAEPLFWNKLPGKALDIAAGRDGSIWIAGTNNQIYRYSGSTWDGRRGGTAKRIAVGPDGNPWVIAKNNTIWRYRSDKWQKIGGLGRDIGIGADGSAWLVGTNHLVYKYTGSKWDGRNGGSRVERIAVAPDGNPWIIGQDSTIWRYTGKKWVKMPGLGRDIAIGAEGAVWLLGTNGSPYKWTNKTWQQHDGGFGNAITVGPYDKPWAINTKKDIYAARDSLNAVNQAAKAIDWAKRLIDLKFELKDFLPDLNFGDLKIEANYAQSSGTYWGHQASIFLYMPKGKKLPNAALTFNQVDANKLLNAMGAPPLIPFALKNLTLFLVPPGNGQKGAKSSDLPKVLKSIAGAVAAKFDLETGRNFLAEIDASKTPALNSLASVIGLKKSDLRNMTISGQLNRFALKKTSKWNKPFGLKDVSIGPATILITTTKAGDIFNVLPFSIKADSIKPPYYRNVAVWGNATVKNKSYLMFSQQAHLKPSISSKPVVTGSAYGFDAKRITLKNMLDLGGILPATSSLSVKNSGKFPFDKLTLSNPRFAKYNAASYAPPVFSDMILVSASAGVVIPDKRTLPGTDGINGTPGPLLYANGALKLDSKALGNADISLSARGLHGKASSKLSFSIGKVMGKNAKLTGNGKFTINMDDANQRMDLEAEIDIAGFVRKKAKLGFAPNSARFSFDAGCAPPVKVDAKLTSPSTPWKGVGNILGDIKVDKGTPIACAGKSFEFVGNSLKKITGAAVKVTDITNKVLKNVSKQVASQISGGMKTVTGKVSGMFRKKRKKKSEPWFKSPETCFPNGGTWQYDLSKCWMNNHQQLYFAKNKSGDGFCLQVNAAKNRNGNKLEIGECDLNWTQQWRFENGKIINAKGRCVDADKNGAYGAKIQLWSCHGRANQIWRLNGRGLLMSSTGHCIMPKNIKDDDDLRLGNCGSHPGTLGWIGIEQPKHETSFLYGHGKIFNNGRSLCLAINSGRHAQGERVAMKVNCPGPGTSWRASRPYSWYLDGNGFLITNIDWGRQPDYCLAVNSDAHAVTEVVIKNCSSPTKGFVWRLNDKGQLVNKLHNMCLTVGPHLKGKRINDLHYPIVMWKCANKRNFGSAQDIIYSRF